MPDRATAERGQAMAAALLDDFAEATGLSSGRPPRRYLWTDAFAVCGFLGLHEATGDDRPLELALALVDQVHHILGRHRPDDPREGWISGLDEAEGAARPTAGGLRIGKPEPERPPGETYHPEREWNRDGQYYHYLTRWMHALNRTWRVTGEPRFHAWAVDLARAAHEGFVAGPRMHWKMSVDLSRPLVPSTGQHDPLDGRVGIEALRATAPANGGALLRAEARELDALCAHASWITHDALGVGGLLTDCLRLVQLRALDRLLDRELEEQVFHDAGRGLGLYAYTHRPDAPAEHRLPFRELGLAIGLRGIERIADASGRAPGGAVNEHWLAGVREHLEVADQIEAFWAAPRARESSTWTDHPDINAVMLAVALAPDGYLAL